MTERKSRKRDGNGKRGGGGEGEGRLLNGKGLLRVPASCGAFSPTLTQSGTALSSFPAWGEERLVRGAAGVPANSDGEEVGEEGWEQGKREEGAAEEKPTE